MLGSLGGGSPPVRIKFPWCTVKPKSFYRYNIDMAMNLFRYILLAVYSAPWARGLGGPDAAMGPWDAVGCWGAKGGAWRGVCTSRRFMRGNTILLHRRTEGVLSVATAPFAEIQGEYRPRQMYRPLRISRRLRLR